MRACLVHALQLTCSHLFICRRGVSSIARQPSGSVDEIRRQQQQPVLHGVLDLTPKYETFTLVNHLIVAAILPLVHELGHRS